VLRPITFCYWVITESDWVVMGNPQGKK